MSLQPQVIVEQSGNLALGALGGLIAAAVGACIWAAITLVTGYQIGFMAIGVGFLVGMAVRYLGRGSSPAFGVVGAALALAGCLAGNLFTIIGFVIREQGISFSQALHVLEPSTAINALVETGGPIDLLFYGIAIYEGFRLSTVPAAARAATANPNG